MESIYNPKLFRSSEHMAVDDYFKSFGEICSFAEPVEHKVHNSTSNDEDYLRRIRQEMNIEINKNDLLELAEACSLSKLTVSGEPPELPMEVPEHVHTKSKFVNTYPITSNAKHLNIIKCLEILEKRYNFTTEFRFGNKRFIKTTTVTPNETGLYNMSPGSNFIYSILVYKPYAISYDHKNSVDNLRLSCEIEALGTNTLAQVADKISCTSNVGLSMEVEDTKVDLKPYMKAKEFYPSQSIFIDGVFYNDFRCSNAIDYSSKIIHWANEKGIGKFESEMMDKKLLNTLKPRLGYPYVYMHQGNCEHIFTFADARLLQPGDCLDSRKYPRIVSVNRKYNKLCFICAAMNCQWIVLNCPKLPHEKVFLCTVCCDSYLFVDGKKVVDFKLYPYYDEEIIEKDVVPGVVD